MAAVKKVMGMTDKENQLRVYLLGALKLYYGDKQISSDSSRARKKLWGLLAYLFCHRGKPVPSEVLQKELWSDEYTNPVSAMKTAMSRLRTMLDELHGGLGHTLILHKNGGYIINPDVALYTDIDDFETLIMEAQSQPEQRNPIPYMKALVLYKKDFFSLQSAEPWVIPVATYYHDLFVRAVLSAEAILEQSGRYEEGIEVCQCGIKIDPYCESFYQAMMRCLMALKKRQEVVDIYEEMSRLLMTTYGVVPDDISRTLYRQALDHVEKHTITPEMLEERLAEQGPVNSALLCDFEFFKNVYQANARTLERSGDAIHIVLLSVKAKEGIQLAKRSLEIIMEHLEQHICTALRRGDMVTRCSNSQYIIMLPQAGYESSILVCERIIKEFYRRYTHITAVIEYHVQPMRAPAK